MSRTIKWDGTFDMITITNTDVNSPMSFEDIYLYFKDNPMSLNYDMPMVNGIADLAEENNNEWTGLNGVSSVTSDTTEHNGNNASIKGIISSLPSVDNSGTQIYVSGMYIYLYHPNTSSFIPKEHIMIKGTNNYDGIYSVIYVYTNYILLTKPKFVKDDAPREYSFEIHKPLTLAWNDDGSKSGFQAIIADKFKFSAKSNNSNAKIIGFAIRNYYGSGTGANRYYYGTSLMKDFNLSTSWTEYEVNIRETNNSLWRKNYGGLRGYWNRIKKIYFFFDNLNINDTIWIDNVRFTCSDRNPKKIGESSYIFPVPLHVSYGSYFKDWGFTVIFNMLQVNSGKSGYNEYCTDGLSMLGGNYLDKHIELGDFSSLESSNKEGGVIVFNHFSIEDTGNINLDYVNLQGITFTSFRGAYGGFNIKGNNTYARNCNFINCINYMHGNNWTFENGAWMGGRYFIGSNNNPLTIDGMTIYGPSYYHLWAQPKDPIPEYKNIKCVDKPNKRVIFTQAYGLTEDKECARFINLDLREVNNPIYYSRNYVPYSLAIYIAFSLKLRILNEHNTPIENAKVIVKNKYNDVVLNVVTDSFGIIDNVSVDVLQGKSKETKQFHFENPSEWTKHYAPFKLRIIAKGYDTYESDILVNGYDKNNSIIYKGLDWDIVLKRNKINIDNEVVI